MTFDEFFNLFKLSFSNSLDWFLSFVSGSFLNGFFSFFIIFTVTRLILIPIIGRSLHFGSSDSVKSKNTNNSKSSKKST